jgi:hypothetical protein
MDILYVVAIIFLILWLVGLLTYTMGGLVHILLVIAVIAVVLRVIRGRKVLGSKS